VDYSAPFFLNFTRIFQHFNYTHEKDKSRTGDKKRCSFTKPDPSKGTPILRLAKLVQQGKTILSSLPAEKVLQKFMTGTQYENLTITYEGTRELVTAYRNGNDILYPCSRKNCKGHTNDHGKFNNNICR